jgi:hypothetical protein
LELATAIPTANEPTIGERPTAAAMPATVKKSPVTMPSMLPAAFHNLSTCNILGTIKIEPTKMAANSPRIWSMRKAMSTTGGSKLPDCIIEVTTERAVMARCHQQLLLPK